MNIKWRRYSRLSIFSFLGSLLLWFLVAVPSQAHWDDLSVAEIVVGETQTQMTLTFPTDLVSFADDNHDSKLSPDEARSHQVELQNILSDRIRLTDSENHRGNLTVKLSEATALPSNLKASVSTHSTLLLIYTWLKPVQGLKIHYNLFLPGVPDARCLATILHHGHTQNHIFSPEKSNLSLMPGVAWWSNAHLAIAIAGAFLWGAMHAMSPGHGKTIVGAYLAGSRATPQHALFLGLTATITHTTGVFALGLVTLFASEYILPEQLYPWLSFLSGLMVAAIGLNLFISRLGNTQILRKLPFGHSHTNHHHSHDHHHHSHGHHHHSHDHHHHSDDHDHHEHAHNHGEHSHLPPGADGSPVTWHSLLALGISGGLLPCPSALVLLLSAIALGRIGFGLVLVLAFSLGLAGVLTGLGLLLVCAKQLFQKLPAQVGLMRALPAVSALCVALIGLGITTQAFMQIGLVSGGNKNWGLLTFQSLIFNPFLGN
ncbi:MAG TPA: ABC transporter permease [Cyanobacteria bacterium UBA8803]|nr:ABC transporter permease [Cyanobacteria bacterium UBA8803]